MWGILTNYDVNQFEYSSSEGPYMDQERLDAAKGIEGWWKCTADTSKQCVNTWTHFDKNAKGYYMIKNPGRQHRSNHVYTAFLKGNNDYKVNWDDNSADDHGNFKMSIDSPTRMTGDKGRSVFERTILDFGEHIPSCREALFGWWKIVANDSKRCVGTYVFFTAEGDGVYMCAEPTEQCYDQNTSRTYKLSKSDLQKKSGSIINFNWKNEKGSTGVEGPITVYWDTLDKGNEAWMTRHYDNSSNLTKLMVKNLSGWWECTANDTPRCIGTFFFFFPTGKGFYNIPRIGTEFDPNKTIDVVVNATDGYKLGITWTDETGDTGTEKCVLYRNDIVKIQLKNGKLGEWLTRRYMTPS